MKKSAYLCASAIIVAGLVPIAAHAAGRSSGSKTSCIDYNNNGVCDSGDAPLDAMLKTGIVNTTTMRSEGNAPAGPIGVVIGKDAKAPHGASVVASGNVHIDGDLNTGDTGFVSVSSTSGDIDVAPGASVKAGDLSVRLVAGPNGSVVIGAGASILSHGGDGPSSVEVAGNNILIGDNARVVAQGYNASLSVQAAGTLVVGHRVTMETTGPFEGPGSTEISAHSDITLNDATLGGRGVSLHAIGNADSPARHIAISGGSITITHGDGALELQADSGADGAGSNSLTGVRLDPADMQIDASPAAVVTAAARKH